MKKNDVLPNKFIFESILILHNYLSTGSKCIIAMCKLFNILNGFNF